jgi:hypothetical protein
VRYGIQLSVTIGDTGSTNIKFSNPQAIKDERGAAFSIDLTNSGERMVKPLVNLELYDAEGKSAGKFDSLPYRIYPGTSSRYRFELPADLPRKTYKVLVIADCGQNKVFGASLNLSLAPWPRRPVQRMPRPYQSGPSRRSRLPSPLRASSP